MTRYLYVKPPPGHTIKRPPSPIEKFKKIFSLVLITIGITALTTVMYPLINYQLFISPHFQRQNVISPLADNEINAVTFAQTPSFVPEVINTAMDYTDAANWYPQLETKKPEAKVNRYNFSIPKLGIKNAIVSVDSDDLKNSLVQYAGTSMPGTLGNPVIFGHSVLPQFFNPNNYVTIFSTLHTLAKGDEIIINYDGIEYHYIIRDMYEVKPDDLSPLAQTHDNYYLTVITCTPPGTYLRRLVIKATLS